MTDKLPRAAKADVESLQRENARLKESLQQAKRVRALYEGSIEKIKKVEASLFDANAILKSMNKCGLAVLQCKTEAEWLKAAIGIIVENSRYEMAWIGYANAEGKGINLVAQAGIEDASVADWHCLMEKENKKPCFADEVIQSGSIRVIKDISLEPDCTPWLDEAIGKGFTSSIFLPLTIDKKIVGVVCLYARSMAAFDPDKWKLLAQFAGDISIGIIFLREKKEHQESERRLAETRNELLSITNSLPVIVYRYRRDEDGTPHILYISERIEDLWGTTVAEAKSDSASMFRHIHPHDIAAFQEADRAAWEARTPFSHEMRVFPPKGEMRWIHLRSTPHQRKDGSLVYDGVVEDITERKLYEEALQQSQARLARAEQIAHVGNWSYEVASGVIEWSDEVWRIFGRTPLSEGITYELFRQWLREDYRQFHDELMLIMANLKPGESVDPYELCVLRPDGDERWVWVTQTLEFDRQGKPVRFFGTTQDQTDRKRAKAALYESEERFRLLFENSGEAILSTGPGGEIYSANPAACRMFGRSEKELRKLGREAVVDASDPRLPAALADRDRTGHFEGQLKLLRKDGTIFPAEVNSTLYRDSNGIERASMIMRDVSERERKDAALKASEMKYRQLFENMTTAFALHEIICDAQGKPADYRFIEVNPAFEALTGIPLAGLVGRTVREVLPGIEDFWIETYGKVALSGEPIAIENFSEELNRYYDVWTFCPGQGKFATIFSDITERKQQEMLLKARLQLTEEASRVDHVKLMQIALDIAEKLTGSSIGFFHFVHEDQETIELQAWSTNTIEHMCNAEGAGTHYPVSKAGVWADAIRKKETVIHNDFPHLDGRKGMPDGHAAVEREICIPILRRGKVEAVIGVGNKSSDYHSNDARLISILADLTWNLVQVGKAEKELQEGQLRYSTLFEAITDAAFVYPILADGSPGTFIEVNEEACRYSGYSRDELLGMAPSHLDTPDSGIDAGEIGSRLLSENSITYQQVHLARDGRRIPVEVHAHLFNFRGQAAVFSLVRDISEREQAQARLLEDEHRFRSLFQSVSDYALVLELQDSGPPVIVDANDAAFKKHGYAREEMIGQPVTMLDNNTTPEQVADRIALIQGGGSARFEVEHVCKDGSTFVADAAARVVEGSDGRLCYAVERDITEHKRAETLMRKRLDELERLTRAAVRREFRIKELKDEIEILKSDDGEDTP
ncbi:MAG TPA: PAS domain S-box protein [Mariprofundaceae bacterium]|nr:PAS domain S-box protein [Mariprofundaceae bacterium]